MSPALLTTNGASHDAPHTNGTNGANGVNGTHSVEKHGAMGFGTRAIHVGSEPNAETGAVIPPLSLSTTYAQTAVGQHKVSIVSARPYRSWMLTAAQGFEYSRSGNPNRDALERTLAAVEAGGAHALAFASGSAATATVIQSLGRDAHVVSVNDVYGGTFRYMARVAAETQGTQTSFVDLEGADDAAILAAFRENTKVCTPRFMA
jgi:cystathionine gamma-lyase